MPKPIACTRRITLVGPLLACAVLFARPAGAVPAVAFDAHQASSAQGRMVRAATVAGVVAGPLGDVSLAITRLDDSIDGPAVVVGAGVGAGLGSLFSLRAGVARANWEHAPDAWTVSGGPEAHFLGNVITARLEQTRFTGGRTVHGASLDLEHTITPRWAARGEASYARGSDGTRARAFLGGARFHAIGPLHLIGEAGMAHDPYGALAEGRGGDTGSPGLVGGILNGPNAPGPNAASQPSSALHPTVLFGVRCVLP